MKKLAKKFIYLDNAASTKLKSEVLKSMKPFLEGEFGNPSSLHHYGHQSRQAINKARSEIAQAINLNPTTGSKEIIFTSGGTESINLAILGVAKSYQTKNNKPGHMIVSSIEHEAVLECINALKRWGWKIDYLKVDSNGLINPNDLKKLVKKDTALISVMYANNEVGTIQPIAEASRILAGINRDRNNKNLKPIYFHTDSCQAGGVLTLDIYKLKIDLLTLNGSKLGGPKGSGILFVRTGVDIEPIIYGGGQERGLRSGTENTPAIVGFAKALILNQKERGINTKKLFELQKYIETELEKLKIIKINGPKNNKFDKDKGDNFGLLKLPGTINFSVSKIEGEALMYYLDSAGFSVATGSACTTGSEDPSHVLLAMGIKPEDAKSTIRLSLSTDITKQDLKHFAEALKNSIKTIQYTTQEL